MTDLYEHTFDGKLLPRHLKMLRDMDSGRIELRYWKFEPILLFLIPFMSVWSGGAIFGCYIMPFLHQERLPFGDCLCLLGRRLDRICHVVAQKASGDFNVWNLKAQARR